MALHQRQRGGKPVAPSRREADDDGAAIFGRARALDQSVRLHLLEQAAEGGAVEHRHAGDLADRLSILLRQRRQHAPSWNGERAGAQHAREVELVLALDRRQVVHRIIGQPVMRRGARCGGARLLFAKGGPGHVQDMIQVSYLSCNGFVGCVGRA